MLTLSSLVQSSNFICHHYCFRLILLGLLHQTAIYHSIRKKTNIYFIKRFKNF